MIDREVFLLIIRDMITTAGARIYLQEIATRTSGKSTVLIFSFLIHSVGKMEVGYNAQQNAMLLSSVTNIHHVLSFVFKKPILSPTFVLRT